MHLDWDSAEDHVLLNSRLPATERHRLTGLLGNIDLKGHVWISTSGSTGQMKWTALSKQAIMASASAVNEFLQSNATDCWIHTLPDFHVGGLGIWARSHLSGAAVVPCKWDPMEYHRIACEAGATLSALVSAQVYDLVVHQLKAPPSLRAIIVGGGALPEELYAKAVELGWKLLPSYGLTETASQVATAPIGNTCDKFPQLQVLPHIHVAINSDGFICLKGPSLLTCYAYETANGLQIVDPKTDCWFQTEDLGYLDNGFLKILGRSGNFIKIGGESVDMLRLEKILEALKLELRLTQDVALIAVPDARLGHVVHLAATHDANLHTLLERFHAQTLPFERIRHVHLLLDIPRSPLGKLQKNNLLFLLDCGEDAAFRNHHENVIRSG
jgi:o-succinylbenzoate---CoA ligase